MHFCLDALATQARFQIAFCATLIVTRNDNVKTLEPHSPPSLSLFGDQNEAPPFFLHLFCKPHIHTVGQKSI